jgi:hypothetical protein
MPRHTAPTNTNTNSKTPSSQSLWTSRRGLVSLAPPTADGFTVDCQTTSDLRWSRVHIVRVRAKSVRVVLTRPPRRTPLISEAVPGPGGARNSARCPRTIPVPDRRLFQAIDETPLTLTPMSSMIEW